MLARIGFFLRDFAIRTHLPSQGLAMPAGSQPQRILSAKERLPLATTESWPIENQRIVRHLNVVDPFLSAIVFPLADRTTGVVAPPTTLAHRGEKAFGDKILQCTAKGTVRKIVMCIDHQFLISLPFRPACPGYALVRIAPSSHCRVPF